MVLIMAVDVEADGHLQAKNGNQEKAAQHQKRVKLAGVTDEADGGQ